MPRDNRCMYMAHICGVVVIVKNSCFLALECQIYVVCLCMSASVSSCRCYMFVSCVHPVRVLNAVFCMTCSLLMLVDNARGKHMEEAYPRAGLMTAL